MARLMELIERLEKLDGPDRAADLEIMARIQQAGQWGESDIAYALTDIEGTTAPPAYTASLDAAVALFERTLPGWFWRTGRTSLFPNGWAYVSRMHPDHCTERDEAACSDGKAATPAIALLIATFRALAEQEKGG